MLAALVIFGAVACTENQEENIPEAKKEPVLSFVANIANDETRVDVQNTDGVWTTVWEENETLILYWNDKEYEFTNADSDDKYVFTCYEEGVRDCVGKPVQIDNGYLDSKAGTKGSWIQADIDSFDPTAVITLVAQTSFFKFTSVQAVTLSASHDIFEVEGKGSVKSVDFAAGEDIMVAFLPPVGEDVTFSCSINGKELKTTTTTFKAKKVYNLGFLGVESDWEISDGTRFYITDTPDLFVAKNVKLTDNKFCLHKVGDTAWGAGAKYGLVTAGTKSENTAIGLYSANWAGDITINNATTTAHDIYFDRAKSRLYVMTVGKHPSTVSEPTNAKWYNIAGTMNNWGSYTAAQKVVYSGDNVWHLVIDFKANDQFKVQLKNGWNPSYGYSKIQGGVGKDLFNSPSDDNAKAMKDGTYEIWVIPAHSDAPLYIIKR